jgi:hypothetical protein
MTENGQARILECDLLIAGLHAAGVTDYENVVPCR